MAVNELEARLLKRIRILESKLDSLGQAMVLSRRMDKSQVVGTVKSSLMPFKHKAFPIGSVFISVVATNPATLLGYGTWAAFGTGKVLVGIDSGDADFDTVEETGGSKTATPSAHSGTAVGDHDSHTHTYTDVVNHIHPQAAPTGASGGTVQVAVDTNASGKQTMGLNCYDPAGGVATGTTAGPSATLAHTVTQPDTHTAMSVIQPYIVVYMWKRTA